MNQNNFVASSKRIKSGGTISEETVKEEIG
jgi:hypothetical protein